MPEYAHSNNEESYTSDAFPTREAALEAARAEYPGETVWVGEILPWDPEICPDQVIDALAVSACDNVGDHAESWLSFVTVDELELLGMALNGALKTWMKATGNEPTFYNIEKVTQHEPEDEGDE